MEKGTPIGHIDNERVKVTEWRLPPGATTGPHHHPFDFVVVPLHTGRLKSTSQGSTESILAELEAGKPFYSPAGADHDMTNVNDHEFVFIEIEVK